MTLAGAGDIAVRIALLMLIHKGLDSSSGHLHYVVTVVMTAES